MGRSQKPTGPAYEELHNQYSEFAWMHEWLHKRRAYKKYASGAQVAAMKLALLAAAVTGALAVALSIRVHSTLRDVDTNQADIHIQVESVREEDLEQPFFYELVRFKDQAKAGEGTLPEPDTVLSLTHLIPGTEYELIYYILDGKGQRTEVGRFRFRTLGQSEKGGQAGSSATGQGPGATPIPIVVDSTPTPSPTPTESAPLLEILTDSLADATEQTGYSAVIAINNTTGKSPSYTIAGYPSGMSATGNTLHGAPAIGTHGSYSVTVTVKADALTATKTLSLTVNPATLAITNGNLGTVYRGGAASGTVRTNFTPPGGLTYGASCALGGGCNAATGAFNIPIPDDAALGEYSIALSAAGSGYRAAKTITFTVKSRPKPVPPVPEIRDLEILYFDEIDTIANDDGLYGGPQFRLRVNEAKDITASLSVAGLPTPVPAHFTLTPDQYAEDGTVVAGTDYNYSFESLGAYTMTLTVDYTLGGVAKKKTATMELARTKIDPVGNIQIEGSSCGADVVKDGPYLDLRGVGVEFLPEGLPYTSMTNPTTDGYSFELVLSGPSSEYEITRASLYYYRYRMTRSHPYPGMPGVLKLGEAECVIPPAP